MPFARRRRWPPGSPLAARQRRAPPISAAQHRRAIGRVREGPRALGRVNNDEALDRHLLERLNLPCGRSACARRSEPRAGVARAWAAPGSGVDGNRAAAGDVRSAQADGSRARRSLSQRHVAELFYDAVPRPVGDRVRGRLVGSAGRWSPRGPPARAGARILGSEMAAQDRPSPRAWRPRLDSVNAGYVAEIYEQYRHDPASVERRVASLFDSGQHGLRAGPDAGAELRAAMGGGDPAAARRGEPDQGSGGAPGAEHGRLPGGAHRHQLPRHRRLRARDAASRAERPDRTAQGELHPPHRLGLRPGRGRAAVHGERLPGGRWRRLPCRPRAPSAWAWRWTWNVRTARASWWCRSSRVPTTSTSRVSTPTTRSWCSGHAPTASPRTTSAGRRSRSPTPARWAPPPRSRGSCPGRAPSWPPGRSATWARSA